MAPPQHKIDTTLQAMERAHRTSPDEQVHAFSKAINVARSDFERFATAEEQANQVTQENPASLYALVEAEREVDQGFDRALEQVKESLAEMERKRMLALGSMTRLSPDEALAEVRKVKEHILSLSLRVPIRADFIVHGHNIGLSLFRLFEAAERAEGEVDALIQAKRSLDGSNNSASSSSSVSVSSTGYDHHSPVQDRTQTSTQADPRPHLSRHTPEREDERVSQTTGSESASTLSSTPRKPMTTTGMRLRQALERSNATRSPKASTLTSSPATPAPSIEQNTSDEEVFQGGDEEFDL